MAFAQASLLSSAQSGIASLFVNKSRSEDRAWRERSAGSLSSKGSWMKKAQQSQQGSCILRRRVQCRAKTYTVEILHGEARHLLQVPEDETILEVALGENLEVSHDCKLGVCMTCPARLEKGSVDQSGGMLSEDVIERGYALMCVSYPLTDCTIRTIPEEELLSLQLATANDA